MSQKHGFFVSPHALAGADRDAPVLVALSGGADSSALLHLLCRDAKEVGYPLYAAHVNHKIRTELFGNEADRDEQFCRELCDRLGVVLFVKTVDVPLLAKSSKQGLEEAARDARYAFFAEIMQKNGIRILATAHNADDNLETQIFNLSRGCAIEGICGIPPVRPFDAVIGGVATRPILRASKRDILDFCQREKIPFVTDSTNAIDDCTRNRIRLHVVPELRELFNSPERSAARLSISAAEDCDFILSTAKQFILDNGYEPEVSALCSLHRSPAKRVIALCFARCSSATLESVHVDAVIELVFQGREGASISLPDKKRAVIRCGRLIFEDDVRNADKKVSLDFCQPLNDGFNVVDGTDFAVMIDNGEPSDNIERDGSQWQLYANAKIANAEISSLYAKNRAEGQTVTDGGVNKKVKKLMCDKKVDVRDRDTLPIIWSSEHIIYVPLCAVSDSVKTRDGKYDYQITVYKKI
jgi:tRNA(Ile)-lysidine synthase